MPWPPPLPPVEQSATARNTEGLLYLKLGERALAEESPSAAIRLLRRAVHLLPDLPHTHAALGAALAREGRDLPAARAALERSLELRPQNAWAHSQLGLLFELEGRPADALRKHRDAVRLDSTVTEYQERLGRAALENKLPKEALTAFEEVVARDSGSVVAVSNLADLYEGAAVAHKAEAMLRRLIDLAPAQWLPWERLARFYERQKRPADAEKARVEVRRLNPPTPVQRTDFRPLRAVGKP